MKKYKIGWPAVVLASVAIAALAMVLTFAPADVQASVIEWMGWGFVALSQFTKPIIQANKERTTDDDTE